MKQKSQKKMKKNEIKKNDQKNYEAGLAALAEYALAFVFTHAHTQKETIHSVSIVG